MVATVRVHLDNEPSAIAETVRARASLPVDDVANSPIVNPRLAGKVRAKSAAFVPVLAEGAVEAVLVIAREQVRPVAAEELAMLAALAAETALALERVRSATALEEALARERLVAGIGRRVRSELDVDAVLRVAVEELGRAVGVSRAFIRLGETGEAMPVLAEWDAPGAVQVGDEAPRLPVLNLALRERRTVRVADIETDDGDPRPRARRRRPVAQARRARRTRDANRRLRPDHRRLRPPPAQARRLVGGGGGTGRGGRA